MNKLETVILDNGLKIYLYNDLRRHSTFFQFTTYCGGITKHFKLDGKNYNIQDGVGHILEHYLVECNDEGNFLDILGEHQMSTNASTSFNTTSYYFEAIEDVLFGIRTVLNGIYNVSFEEKKLEKLKGPILQEIRGRFDNKFYHLNRLRMKNIFNNIDILDVGGSLDDVSNTSIDDLEALYNAFYHPDNQFIVIAGNFDKDSVINEIRNFYNNISLKKHDVELITYKEKYNVCKSNDVLLFPTPMNYLDISFKLDISSYSNNELLDLDFYLHVFFNNYFGNSSLLHKKLIDEKIIIDGISCSKSFIDKYMIISIGGYTNNSSVFKENILDTIKNMDKFDSEYFDTDKKTSIVSLILRDENIFKMVFPLINNIIYYNYPYLDKVSDVERLSYDEYVSTIKKLDFSNYSVIEIKNKDI